MSDLLHLVNATGFIFMTWMYMRWQRRALKAEARVKAVDLVFGMLKGQKPTVTKAPNGLTIEEAQIVIDHMYEALHGQRPN